MTVQTANSVRELPEASPFPAAILDKLAARFRAAGLCLTVFNSDGEISYFEPAAGAFFTRYVLPLARRDLALAGKIRNIPADAEPLVIDTLPGALLAVCPFVDRRQAAGFVSLAARVDGFEPNEDLWRACTRISTDAEWVLHQANSLPGYSRDTLLIQAGLLGAMLRDQLRIVGMQVDLNDLSEQLANTYEELSLIYQISSGMRVNRRASDFFKQTCQDVLEVMDIQAIGVALHADDESRNKPVLYGPLTLPDAVVCRLSTQLLPLLRERKGQLLINDVAADKEFSWLVGYASQLLAVPLQRQEDVLGCLFVLDKPSGEFDSMDSKLLNSIANESAIYLENSQLFSDAHGLMMGLMHSLTSAVDAKDAYTCGHSERVALLSRHLAVEIGLSDAEVDRIYMAGLLHDVGKIGVPESVLQKTGRLTADEFDQMKKHPQIGARILADVKQIKSLIPGVLHHHERYDGKGYPSGLAGNHIPLMGRIICLADCFDAMTSNRTYRKALPLEVALTEIRRCAGTQFDPNLAEAFLRTRPDFFRELLRDHAEKAKKLLTSQEHFVPTDSPRALAMPTASR